MSDHPSSYSTTDLICRKCNSGYMEATKQEDEPEYTENYQCTNCGHSAIIPSGIIITSQLCTGIVGGILSLYLFFEEFFKLLSAMNTDVVINMANSVMLMMLAIVFFLGFGFTFYRAIKGVKLRRLYRRGISTPVE